MALTRVTRVALVVVGLVLALTGCAGAPRDDGAHDTGSRDATQRTPATETSVPVAPRPTIGPQEPLGLRRPDGSVTVWHPDRILTEPGEWGCQPSLAVAFPPGHVAGA